MNGTIGFLVMMVIGAMATAGCGSDSGSPTGPSGSSSLLMPLKTGNQWNYAVEEFDTTGRQTATKMMTNVVAADTLIQGESWYFLNEDRATPTRTTANGIYYWDKATGRSHLYLASPVSVGASYEKDSQRYTAISGSTQVDVPAGTFNSAQILISDTNIPSVTSIASIAPGVGLVKLEVVYRKGDAATVTVSRWQLASYTLK